MKSILIIPIFIIISLTLSAQEIKKYDLGHFIDINDQLIHNYIDVDYNPEIALNIWYHIGLDYTPGYYYNKNNEKINGSFKKAEAYNFFRFKESDSAKVKKIKPEECNGLVFGADSFAIITIKLNENESYEKRFAKVLEKIDNLTYYMYGSDRYFCNTNGRNYYIEFPVLKSTFNDIILSLHGGFELLRRKVEKNLIKKVIYPKLLSCTSTKIN